jgi:hypothetical protein
MYQEWESLLKLDYHDPRDPIFYAVNLENSLKNISRTIKPRLNQSDQVNVTIFMVLISMQDYDEVSGTLRLVVSYVMKWSDEIRIWDPVDHGNLTSIREICYIRIARKIL